MQIVDYAEGKVLVTGMTDSEREVIEFIGGRVDPECYDETGAIDPAGDCEYILQPQSKVCNSMVLSVLRKIQEDTKIYVHHTENLCRFGTPAELLFALEVNVLISQCHVEFTDTFHLYL